MFFKKKVRRKTSINLVSDSLEVLNKSSFIYKVIQKIEDYPFLIKLRNNYTSKLNVINKNDIKANELLATYMLLGNIGISSLIVFGLSLFMSVWYVLAVLAATMLYLGHSVIEMYLGLKLKKIYKQFPEAIQLFTDIYMGSRNIKKALNEAYVEMPKEIGTVFEKLSRELSSSYDYQTHIKTFAKSLGYTWGYAFTELLMMSYEGGGDISDDLVFLNELINDDIQDAEETKSEMASNKMMFMILMGATGIAFVGNIMANPIAKSLYFYTPMGNNLIMAWVLVLAVGITAMAVLDNT